MMIQGKTGRSLLERNQQSSKCIFCSSNVAPSNVATTKESLSILKDWATQWNCFAAAVIFLLQSSLLNYCLVYKTTNNYWFLWIVVDVPLLILMVYAFIITYVRTRSGEENTIFEKILNSDYPGELPFCFWIWTLYGVALVTRVTVLYKRHATDINEDKGVFGPSVIQGIIGLALPILYFLMKSLSLNKSKTSSKEATENWLVMEEGLNILDALDLMTYLIFANQRALLPSHLDDVILSCAGLVLLVPSLHFAVYARTKYDSLSPHGRGTKALHAVCSILFVNGSLMVVRLIIWHWSSLTVSAFLIKNAVCLYMCIVRVAELVISRPTCTIISPPPQLSWYRPSFDVGKSWTSVNTVS